MRIRMYITLAVVIVVLSALLPSSTYARGGHHGHGHHHRHHGHHNFGHSWHIGLGFVFPLHSYGYPYYAPAPVYRTPVYLPPANTIPSQRSNTTALEKSDYCREFTKRILIDGKEETAYGTACLQDDGSWRIVN